MINKKGQNLLLALMTAIMLFMAGMLFLNHLMVDVSLARATGLDCSNPTISDGTKVTCLGIDLVIPVLIIAIVSISLGAVLSRFVL